MQIINSNLLDKNRREKLKSILEEIFNMEENKQIINDIKGIKLVEPGILHSSSSGRIIEDFIVLPADKIGDIVNNYNEECQIIKSNILHEISHVKLKKELPQLHEMHQNALVKEDFITGFTIGIYIEYLTHLESTKHETEKMIDQYMQSINDYNWNFQEDISKINFIKHSGYIIARAEDDRVKEKNYISNFKNIKLKKEIENIQKLLKHIKREDNYDTLLPLENIVKQYISND